MSPIKGISEVIRLPRLGKIRLGSRRMAEGTSLSGTDGLLCLSGRSKKGLRRKTPRTADHVSD